MQHDDTQMCAANIITKKQTETLESITNLEQSTNEVASNDLESGPEHSQGLDDSLVCEEELMAAVMKCALAHVATAKNTMHVVEASSQPLQTDFVVSTDQHHAPSQPLRKDFVGSADQLAHVHNAVIVMLPGSANASAGQQETGEEGLITGSAQTTPWVLALLNIQM